MNSRVVLAVITALLAPVANAANYACSSDDGAVQAKFMNVGKVRIETTLTVPLFGNQITFESECDIQEDPYDYYICDADYREAGGAIQKEFSVTLEFAAPEGLRANIMYKDEGKLVHHMLPCNPE